MLRFFASAGGPGGSCHRREWLRISTLAGWGMLPAVTPDSDRRLSAASRPPNQEFPGFGRARSVILVYASGGQSQIDMWDPKPGAPDHIRGAFSTLSTAVPGLAFCEHLPRLSRIADRFAVLRNLSHEDLDHGSATYLALTGRYHSRLSSNPAPSPNDFPTYGAVWNRITKNPRALFEAVHVNGPALVPFTLSPGQNGGFLGREYEPVVVGDVSRQAVAIPGLAMREHLSKTRLLQRKALKESLNARSAALGRYQDARDVAHLYDRASDMLLSPQSREAFDLSRERPALRDRYGRHRSGQACLLARRLVEAGVPLITVIWNHSNRGQDKNPLDTEVYGWDTHNDIFSALRQHLLPRFDESFSALLEDLDERGLLDETLVVCMGEFGRAPQVALEPSFLGRTPGRKHWARVYSMVMAGAGVTPGAVLGASDRWGGEPAGDALGPWDVAATMFAALGVDPGGHFEDPLGRPFAITTGRPIHELYAGQVTR